MPVIHGPDAPRQHSEKLVQAPLGHFALATRQLTPAELRGNPQAAKRLDAEWARLTASNTWDANEVCEYATRPQRRISSPWSMRCTTKSSPPSPVGKIFASSSDGKQPCVQKETAYAANMLVPFMVADAKEAAINTART